MAYNPYSEVVESLWNDYPDAQDEAVSRASMLAQGSLCEYADYASVPVYNILDS